MVNCVGSKRHDDNHTEPLLLWVTQLEHWSHQYSALTWDDRGILLFSMSHNTNSKTKQQWLIHTVDVVSHFPYLFSVSTDISRRNIRYGVLTWFSTASFKHIYACKPAIFSLSLSQSVSLYMFLFFALMWFCVFLRSKKVVWIEEFFSSNNAEIVTILWLLSIHYCVVQGDSASCLSLSQRPKQNPGNFSY